MAGKEYIWRELHSEQGFSGFITPPEGVKGGYGFSTISAVQGIDKFMKALGACSQAFRAD